MQVEAANDYFSGIFLQTMCPPTSDLYYHELTPENVGTIIDFEMKKVIFQWVAEEENFVYQKLTENPVICARRSSKRSGSESTSSSRDPLQQQRAESSRRSRIKNKIKKAKGNFHHKFITMKIAQNAATLDSINDLIAHYREAVLRKLPTAKSIDQRDINNMSDITRELLKMYDYSE